MKYTLSLQEDNFRPGCKDIKFMDYVNSSPALKAAIYYNPGTATLVSEVFKWSRDTESTPPTTMT